MPALRHAILGAGGVGGTMAACLAHIGESVTLIVRPQSVGTYPTEIRLESPFGNIRVPVAHAHSVPAVDVLWITTKATQLDSALKPIPTSDTAQAIVPLLNGIDHLAVLRERYGQQRVIPATIAGEMERVAPGSFVHRTPFLFLNLSSSGRGLLGQMMASLERMGLECRFIDDEPTLMWSKIVFLAPMALSTTAADMPIGGVREDATWRGLWESCVRETCAVAIAEGAKVDPDAVLQRMRQAPGAMRSSMQKDVDRGKAPELDAIAGPILRAGTRYGIKTPATEKLAANVERRAQALASQASRVV